MNNTIYEKVNLNPKLPALLGYFGKENSDVKGIFIVLLIGTGVLKLYLLLKAKYQE